MFLRSLFLDDDAAGNSGGGGTAVLGIEGAIAAAKQRLANGESIVPAPDAPAVPVKKEGEEAEPKKEGEQEPKKEGEEAEPKKEGEESEPEVVEADELVLPPLAEGEEPINLGIIEDEGLKARLEGIIGRAAQVDRVERREADIAVQRAELDEFQDLLTIDPFLVLLDHTEPEIQSDLVLGILMQQGGAVWAELKPILMQLDDPKKMMQLQANLAERRRQMQPKLEGLARERKVVAESQRVVTSGVATLAESLPKAKREVFTAAAYKAIQAYNKRTGNNRVQMRDLPVLLNEVLTAHGLELMQAADLLGGKRATSAKREDPPTKTALARKPTSAEALAAEAARKAAAQAGAVSSVVTGGNTSALEEAKKSAKPGDMKGLFASLKKAAGIAR